ncbi:C-Maf-inducing protein-like [Cataglyphis hispanica]|uniref:C-Maf-inducing protein-like n=1 Tax=Cataglyphis hispanica TaxID=1086592 RepID=UPI00217F24E9|nr:C-Maf-inducing protein-like [Cataglyphis hispanica]XP_050450984.1 C-Maf-inducing protein-like [Cataglyphis hispanica]XP_050450985.1 C-Maf-inducing protein-like [Cataglyphis hispanica]XP_050450986.1 C-Maf-inducing protein-like [Cataglyphis hispanica]
MFCFQSPFTRSSRSVVSTASLSTSKSKSSLTNAILSPTAKTSNATERNRRGSEATSEGSNSSIRYIDQEASMSDGSSTDTLPGIRADYLDSEPLSLGADALTSPSGITVLLNGTNGTNEVQDESHQTALPSPTKKSSGNGSSWHRKLMLRLRSTDFSSLNNDETRSSSTSPSPASESTMESTSSCSRNPRSDENRQDANATATTVSSPSVQIDMAGSPQAAAVSIGDIPSLENGFSEEENDDDVDEEVEEDEEEACNLETETEDGSSLPSSPAAASTVGLTSSAVPYYDFLSVNGGAMRQETTSTSSPQLSSGASLRSSVESPPADTCSSYGEDSSPGMDSLKPEGLDASGCLPAARSCPNLERQSAGCSSASGSSSPSPSPGPAGPRFKPLEEGDIQVCYLNHTRTLVRKILSSKFLRRWETHHLYLNDACLSSKTLTGFLQQPVPYSSMSEVRKYVVARWDPAYKNCLSIVLPDGSLLLQASNAYTRDQWYHSILWKKSIFKYQHLVSMSTREEVILRELRIMVDFALWTPLQDERVAGAPLEAVAKLLEEPNMDPDTNAKIEGIARDRRSWAEAVLSVVAPLLEKAAPPAALARALARLAQQHPRSQLVPMLGPAITRCLKHTVDFGKSPDMRKLLQVFVAALYENNDGEQAIRDYISSVHGPSSDCPHPRILPNLVSICVAAIFHRFEVSSRVSSNEDKPPPLPPLQCYLLVLNIASEYADWRPGLGALLQPVPFPEEALAMREVQESVLMCVMQRLAKDPRCTVHRVLLPVREPRPGWIHIAAPSSPACPDRGELFGEMLTTLLACCCRRKRFIASLLKQAGDDCILLAVRGCDAAQEALCLMLEWRLLPNEEARLQIVNALESTESGKERYAALCQRQKNLQELQQKGGPRKLTLPVRATDADVALLLGGRALGNLECLSLAFTSVTSACAEQLIKLPALRYLNLWATQFGDAGLQMISEHLQKLQVLNLCETPVSDKGISTLASLTSLRKLNLNSTKLSAQTFESLKKRLPALQEFDVRYTEAW